MNTRFTIGSCLLLVIVGGLFSCKQRAYNQARTKDLADSSDSKVTICTMVTPNFKDASTEAKASVRVSCQGQCNGADYRNRRFYISNDEKIQGLEFSAKLTTGRELRNMYVFSPEHKIIDLLNQQTLENTEFQKALANYGIDPANVSNLTVPQDAKVLLGTGTRASLSSAGLYDGGTLDCGGKPVDGAVDLTTFKDQNLVDVKNTTALP